MSFIMTSHSGDTRRSLSGKPPLRAQSFVVKSGCGVAADNPINRNFVFADFYFVAFAADG